MHWNQIVFETSNKECRKELEETESFEKDVQKKSTLRANLLSSSPFSTVASILSQRSKVESNSHQKSSRGKRGQRMASREVQT